MANEKFSYSSSIPFYLETANYLYSKTVNKVELKSKEFLKSKYRQISILACFNLVCSRSKFMNVKICIIIHWDLSIQSFSRKKMGYEDIQPDFRCQCRQLLTFSNVKAHLPTLHFWLLI